MAQHDPAPAATLPELMRFADGRPVETAEQWAERRKEIRSVLSPKG